MSCLLVLSPSCCANPLLGKRGVSCRATMKIDRWADRYMDGQLVSYVNGGIGNWACCQAVGWSRGMFLRLHVHDGPVFSGRPNLSCCHGDCVREAEAGTGPDGDGSGRAGVTVRFGGVRFTRWVI
ncbi:unnamed protein product [Protopolystoma xenopodis]|uniref:Uncharacterized protein n=1 Tax=Protopolystoma xenopodis TaxID=117903 RepID=A0A448WBJ9_9PLAT|nr:unnamed protein product [Protopolystoma xenopodis]